ARGHGAPSHHVAVRVRRAPAPDRPRPSPRSLAPGALLALPLDPLSLAERARGIRWLLLDVDGVLTDGRVYFGESAEPAAAFDIKDGLGLGLARRAGLKLGVLSGRVSQGTEARARGLGFDAVVLGCTNKARALAELAAQHGFAADEAAYIGDDLPD